MKMLTYDLSKVFNEIFNDFPEETPYVPDFPFANIKVKKGEGVVFYFALAGYRKENISLECAENHLILNLKQEEEKDDGSTYLLKRIRQSDCTSKYFVSQVKYDFNKIESSYDNGMLRVFIPENEDAKPKKIEIK